MNALFDSFNPRTRTGCDILPSQYVVRKERFQPTHPHGVRPSGLNTRSHSVRFNPRTRTGCDTCLDIHRA